MSTAGPSLRERNRQRAKQEISAAAAELFASRGYTATSVEQIASAAGVSARTFFRYFPAKEDVLFEGHRERVALLREALADAPAGSPWEQVGEAVLVAQFAPLGDDAEHARALARIVDAEPTLQARAAQLSTDLEAVVAEHLTRSGLDAKRAALLAGALFGALHAARRLAAHDRQATPQQLVTQVLALLEPLGRAEARS